MNEIASPGQLRMSFIRWALVTVPSIVGLGTLMGRLSNGGYGNPWFDALTIPDIMPPGWLFGVAWAILYTMQALALALILNARGAADLGDDDAEGDLLLAGDFEEVHDVVAGARDVLVERGRGEGRERVRPDEAGRCRAGQGRERR